MQCIPILRPILREFTTTLTSRRLQSTDPRGSTFHEGRSSKRGSYGQPYDAGNARNGNRIALQDISEEEIESWKRPQSSSTDRSIDDRKLRILTPSSPLDHKWPSEKGSPRTMTTQQSRGSSELSPDPRARSFLNFDTDVEAQRGLHPPPRRMP